MELEYVIEGIEHEEPDTGLLSKVLGWITEIPAALLVVAEIVILGGGAFTRYALQAPLPWTDELAGILFLWLAMLGAVVALRRGEHMRMTAFVGKASPPLRAFLDVLAIVAAPCKFPH